MLKLLISLLLFTILNIPVALAQMEDPDAGLETIKSISHTIVDKKGSKKTIHEFEYIVKAEAGRVKLTNYRTHFIGPKNSFKLLSAYVKKNNQQYNVSQNQVTITNIQNPAIGILDLKQVSIPIRDVQIDSTVYISYQTVSQELGDFFHETLAISNSSLAKDERYIFESPTPVNFITIDDGEHFSITSKQEKGNYLVEVKPKASAYSLLGKKVVTTVVMFSNAPDWKTINKFYSEEYKKVWGSKLPPLLDKIAKSAQSLKTPKEQIEFVSTEIFKVIAYSGNWVGSKGKFLPQTLDKLAKNKTGDCKDFATALTAVLRQLNFKSFPALTTRTPKYLGKKLLQKMASLAATGQFNHAITWAQDSTGKVWWIDPTNPLVIADVISADILGNFALILDGESQNVAFLPEKNLVPNDSTIEQTFKVSADNTVSSAGKFTLNESSYNQIGQYERIGGLDSIKKIVNILISPEEPMSVNITKKAKDPVVPSYSFNFIGDKIVYEEKGELKALVIPQPIFLVFTQLQKDKDSYIGEIGTFKYITKVENLQTIDTFEADCYTRTPWIDADRVVTNENGSIVITDTVVTKQRIITKEEMESKQFQFSVTSLLSCARNSQVKLYSNSSLSTSLDELERFGSASSVLPLEKMTDKDAFALLGKSSSALLKFIKYYKIKVMKNPNDVEAMSWIARGLMSLGGSSLFDYDKSHVESALVILNDAHKKANGKYNKVLYRNKIFANMRLGNFTDAAKDLKIYSENETDKFSIYMITAELAKYQKSDDLFEQWYVAAEKLIKTSEDYKLYAMYNKVLLDIYRERKAKISEYEALVKKDPKNYWNHYLLATSYYTNRNSQKAIETAKASLALKDNWASRQLISRTYMANVFDWINLNIQKNRMPSSSNFSTVIIEDGANGAMPKIPSHFDNPGSEKVAADLEEAISWNPYNESAYSQLIDYYMNKIDKTTDAKLKLAYQNKFKEYFPKYLAMNSENTYIQTFKRYLPEK